MDGGHFALIPLFAGSRASNMAKTLHAVYPPVSESKFIGDEPTWTTVDDSKYNSEIGLGLNWHNYCASEKNYRKYLEEWMKEYRPKTYKDDILLWRKVPDSMMDKAICKIARMQLQGFPLNEKHAGMIVDYVATITKKERGKKVKVVEATVVQKGPSVQDRIRQQVSGILSNLDFSIDEAFDGRIPDIETLKGDVLSHGFKGPQLKLVSDYLIRNISEWQSAYAKEDADLVEGYSYVPRRAFKKIIDVFQELIDAVSQQHTKIKAQRIVKKNPQDKKKLASKLKYMVEDTNLGIKSAPPVTIIGANMLWVYDTKKRLLGYYEGESPNSLFIRGSVIDGFKTTCVKILRKPDEQLPEFMKLRKNQTTNWIDAIKAKCKPLTGRMGSHILILRVD